MLLSRFTEKSQLASIYTTATFFMKNQAFPIGQRVLGLSLGLGGVLNILCVSAFADPVLPEAQDTTAASENDDLDSNSASKQAGKQEDSDRLKDSPLRGLMAASHETLVYPRGYVAGVEDSYSPSFSLSLCEMSSCEIAEVAPDADLSSGVPSSDSTAPEENIGSSTFTELSTPVDPVEPVVPVDIESLEIGPLEIDRSEEARPDISQLVAQVPDFGDLLPEERLEPLNTQPEGETDDELGNLRLQLQRSRTNEDLGILRLIQTAQAAPPPPKQPIAFLAGRLGFLDSDNVFRSNRTAVDPRFGDNGFIRRLDEQVYQAGLTFFLFPKLSESTNLYAIAGTTLVRYDEFSNTDTNQVELQLGVRQRLAPRTFAQLGWRNQRFYSPGYREKKLGINYIDAQISHRTVLSSRTWLDSFYQARLGFAESLGGSEGSNTDRASRFRQTLTLSLNHGLTKDLRTSLLYQLDFDDYTQIPRFDTYQQVLGVISYSLTPESRLSLFGGTRFGRSSSSAVNLDDTFYGAGLNVNVPLF